MEKEMGSDGAEEESMEEAEAPADNAAGKKKEL